MDLPFSTHREISFGVQTTPDFIHGKDIDTIRKITESDYQDIENYNSKTLYIVQADSGAIKLYLGATPLGGVDISNETLNELNQKILQLTAEMQVLKDRIQIVALSQEEYDDLEEIDEKTLYAIL